MSTYSLIRNAAIFIISTLSFNGEASGFSCSELSESPKPSTLASTFFNDVYAAINKPEYFSVVKTYEEMKKLKQKKEYKKLAVEALVKETSTTEKPDWMQNAALILAAKMAASIVEETLKNMKIYEALKSGKNSKQSFSCAIPTIKHLIKHTPCNYMGKPIFNPPGSLLAIPFKNHLQIVNIDDGDMLGEFKFDAKINTLAFKGKNRNKVLSIIFEKPVEKENNTKTTDILLNSLEQKYLYSLKPHDSKLLSSLNQTWNRETDFELPVENSQSQTELKVPSLINTSEFELLAPLNKNLNGTNLIESNLITTTTNTTPYNDIIKSYIPQVPRNSLVDELSKIPPAREYSFNIPVAYEQFYDIETHPDLGYSTIKELISNESILGPTVWKKIRETMPGTACQANLGPGFCLGAITTDNDTKVFELYRQLKALYFFFVELLKHRAHKEATLILPSQGWGRPTFSSLNKKIQKQLINALNVHCPTPQVPKK